jgi:hypothetical protein
MSVTDEEVVYERSDAMHKSIAFSQRVGVSGSLDHGEKLFDTVMFVSVFISLEHESSSEAVVEAVGDGSGDVSLVNRSELAVSMESINDVTAIHAVLHVGEHIRRVRSVDEIGG